jgi:replication factor A1
MQNTKDSLYDQIKDLKTKEEFEEEIHKRYKEYDGLLNEDTIALLIVDELGRNNQNICKIANLEPGIECTVFGKVTNIRESRTFTRKNGSSGRVINLELTDDTGTCGLVLWDEDVGLVHNNTIKNGTIIKVINSYIKEGFTGIEANLGRWSMLEIEPEDAPTFTNELPTDVTMIKGTLIEVEGTRAFFKDDGEFATIKNKDNEGTKQLIIWNEKVKEIQHFNVGDEIEIRDIDMRQKDGTTEIHVNGRGTIKKG